MEIKNLNEYQLLALRTKPDLSRRDLMLNAALGSTGEAGELSDAIKKHVYHNHPLPFENVAKELGDMMWYISLMAEVFGYTLQEIAEMNIEKLRTRYPEGFSTVDSIKRVDVK